jgi:hypothetical protein
MKISLSICIVGVAALSLAQPVQAGRGGGGGGGGRSFGGGGHFSGGGHGYSGGAHYSGGSHYSSGGYSRGSYGAGPRYTAANIGGARYTPTTGFRNPTYNSGGRQYGGTRNGAYAGNRGTFAGNRNGRLAGNQTTAYNSIGRTRNGAHLNNGVRSSGFNPNGRNVVARHNANWHSNWSRNHDHNWHGHRCHFHNGFWYVYDPFPFYYPYPYWDYYPYETYYDSGYDQGAYSDQGVYEDNKNHQYSQDQSADGSHISDVQRALAREGYYDGAVDGVLGAGTRRALRNYQRDHNLDVTGGISQPLIEALRLR